MISNYLTFCSMLLCVPGTDKEGRLICFERPGISFIRNDPSQNLQSENFLHKISIDIEMKRLF